MVGEAGRGEEMSGSARDIIFGRIDAAVGSLSTNPAGDWEKIARDYIRQDVLAGSAVIGLFEHRLVDYGAHLFHCAFGEIRSTIENILSDRSAKRLLIPSGLPAEWLPANGSFTEDLNLSYDKLDSFDGVLTSASAAIAATGSIVLQHGPGQGRRALSLIPDYHLCVVFADQVVETVPAAFARLDPRRPTTFISGPSATADIEMTRIKGVHGPRFLDVVLVQG
jgi:L-lactate dehydrogenase complex protein LldG